MKRKFTFSLLIAVLVFFCCGLAFAGGTNEESAAASQQEKHRINYWMFGPPTREADRGLPANEWYITGAIDRFEAANPTIDVELLVLPDEGRGEKFKAAGIAKNGPDVCNLWAGSMLTDNKQFILSLDDYFTAEELENAVSVEAVRENTRPDGILLGMPRQNTVLTFYYNKKIFRDAGIDDSIQPKTLAEFHDLCDKLLAAGITPLIIGDKEGYHSAFLLMTFYAGLTGPYGIQEIVTGKTTFSDDPNWIKASQAYQDLYMKGYTNVDVVSLDNFSSQTKFLSDSGAIVTSAPDLIASAFELLGDDLGMMQIPPVDKSSPYAKAVVGGAGQALVVSSYSKYPDDAVKFIKFLISKEEQENEIKIRDKGTGETCYKDVDSSIFVDPYSRKLQDISKTGLVVNWLDNQLPSDVANEFYRLSPIMLSGKLSVAEYSAQLDVVLKKVLEKK